MIRSGRPEFCSPPGTGCTPAGSALVGVSDLVYYDFTFGMSVARHHHHHPGASSATG